MITTPRIGKEEAMNSDCFAGIKARRKMAWIVRNEIARKHHLKRTKCHLCRLKLSSSQSLQYYQIPIFDLDRLPRVQDEAVEMKQMRRNLVVCNRNVVEVLLLTHILYLISPYFILHTSYFIATCVKKGARYKRQ